MSPTLSHLCTEPDQGFVCFSFFLFSFFPINQHQPREPSSHPAHSCGTPPADDISASCSKSAECDFIDWRRWACRFSTQERHAFSCLFLKQVVKWIVHIKGQHKTLATASFVELTDFINQSREFREDAFSLDRKRSTSKSRGKRPKYPQAARQWGQTGEALRSGGVS